MKSNQKLLDEKINASNNEELRVLWTAVKRASNYKLDLPLVEKLGAIYALLESALDDICQDEGLTKGSPTLVAKVLGSVRLLANCEEEAQRSIEIPVEIMERAKEAAGRKVEIKDFFLDMPPDTL